MVKFLRTFGIIIVMNKKLWVIVGVIVAIFGGMIGFANLATDKPVDYGKFQRSTIQKLAKEIDYNNYDLNTIIVADENSGNLPEKVEGNPEAPVVIYEYADYACTHCAEWNRVVNQIVEDYEGQVAVVFRGFVMQFPNSMIAASAANAAAMQGCWKEYKDLLFVNQNKWFYLRNPELTDYLAECFEKASDGKGDVERFKTDMASEAVARRIAFDYGLGEKADLSGTPMFMIDGQKVDATNLKATVASKLKKS